jgi:hypothetical protein
MNNNLLDLKTENKLLKEQLAEFKEMLLRLQNNQLQIIEDNNRLRRWYNEAVEESEYLQNLPTNIVLYKFGESEFEDDLINAPVELSRVKNLKRIPLNAIVPPPGVYFLYHDKVLQYIGQSVNVYSRLNQHAEGGEFVFNKIYFLPCHVDVLDKTEKEMIRHFTPPFNKQKYNGQKKDGDYVERILFNKPWVV